MPSRDAVVVGGGIGGSAVAGGLARIGWRVTVLEQADAFAPVGAGIGLEPNAVKALGWLGLGDALADLATAQGPTGLRTAGGRWLITTDLAAFRERFGAPVYALHRADLHQLLLDAARGADLRTGQHVTGVRRQDESVAVHTTAGLPRADLVVAADGIHSAIRSSLFPGHPRPAYAGNVVWRGVVDGGVDVPAAVTESWGRGERFGVVPLADGRVYWFAGVYGPEGTGAGHDLAALAERFAGWHDPIPRLLAATRPESVLRHDIQYLREPLPSYVDGRVALLGDAAHAITPDLGQGAALALEDAVVLTASLADRPDNVPAALARYDLARRERTQQLVRVSAQVGRIVAGCNPVTAWLRNQLVGLIPAGLFLRATDGALSWTPPTCPLRSSVTSGCTAATLSQQDKRTAEGGQ